VYEQAVPVRALDQIGRAQQRAIRLVDPAVAVLVADLAVVVEVDGGRADDVALPGSDAVRVGLDLTQPLVGGEEVEAARQQPTFLSSRIGKHRAPARVWSTLWK